MGFGKDGSVRRTTVLMGIGVVIFCFGLCLLIFGRAYEFDSTHHDLFLVFGCVFMVPGGIMIFFGGIHLLRIYLFVSEASRPQQHNPYYQASMPRQDPQLYNQDDVFVKTDLGRQDYMDQKGPHESIKQASVI